jgi:hypothetical protein
MSLASEATPNPSMTEHSLPRVVAGPILRRVTSTQVIFWVVTSEPCSWSVELEASNKPLSINSVKVESISLASRVIQYLLIVNVDTDLPRDTWIDYDLLFTPEFEDKRFSITELVEGLCYEGRSKPGFIFKRTMNSLLHGSCRKPHLMPAESVEKNDSGDGLVRADAFLQSLLQAMPSSNHQGQSLKEWPSLLLMTGDQVYVDDVAGPMLSVIHQVIDRLGFVDEPLEGTELKDSRELCDSTPYYYKRDEVLPKTELAGKLRKQFFSGAKKPVFTSSNAKNHLITLSEMIAMYLLVWSPELWDEVDWDCPSDIEEAEQRERFAKETIPLKAFSASLYQVRRVLAHLPTAMIFDDHDVTDDWNLTASWEKAAYEHPLSRRVIGNALLAYCVFQGLGNAPEKFPDSLKDQIQAAFNAPGSKEHNDLITDLFAFNDWHYEWDTHPILIVLDTRTHRWRSESNFNKPSGLMDWEALTDLQQTLLGHKAVVMVSPAPVFGVKLIENIQRLFTWFGHPLVVDAENWMAHKGAAHALMNLFRHPKTPHNFVILSGDVHYSFVYDIELRGQKNSPNIWQITSSGIRNEFPPTLLNVFDRLNRWLYAPSSPLNWFTKRRRMKITPRRPENASKGERLLNGAGIGWVVLDNEGAPQRVRQLCANQADVDFELELDQAHWE